MNFNSFDEGKAYYEKIIASTTHEPTKRAFQQAYDKFLTEGKEQQTQDKMGQLSDNLLNFNSDFYKQYASYLQKNVGGVGANSLLAPLMAGGAGYAGGQAIAGARAKDLLAQRQDKVNTGVQGFALGNINTGANLLGQQGNLQLGYANLAENQRQYNDQNSGFNKFFSTIGQGFAMFNPFGGGGGASSPSGVNGYGYSGNSASSNPSQRY